jgi:hypothetical protein
MSEFDDKLATMRAARVADLDLIAELFERIKLLDARVGALDGLLRRQRERPEAQTKPKATARVKGVFCVYCGKPLGEAKTARVFCSRACANRWHAQHRGMRAQPRLSLNGDRFQSTIVAGEGERPTG